MIDRLRSIAKRIPEGVIIMFLATIGFLLFFLYCVLVCTRALLRDVGLLSNAGELVGVGAKGICESRCLFLF